MGALGIEVRTWAFTSVSGSPRGQWAEERELTQVLTGALAVAGREGGNLSE